MKTQKSSMRIQKHCRTINLQGMFNTIQKFIKLNLNKILNKIGSIVP